MPFYRLLLDKTQKKNEIPLIKNKKPRFSFWEKSGPLFSKKISGFFHQENDNFKAALRVTPRT